jgi:hypothetical protein
MGPHNVRQSARNRCEKQADALVARAIAIGNAMLAAIFESIEKRQAGPGEPRPLHSEPCPSTAECDPRSSADACPHRGGLVKFNHLDLQTTDVQALAGFFVEHFDLVRRSNDRSPAIAILGDDVGFTLVIQRRTDAAPYPAGFHVGFIVDRASDVRAQHARLAAAGIATGSIDVNGRGTRFYLQAPDAIVIEVSSPDRGE